MAAKLVEDGRVLFETVCEDGLIGINDILLETGCVTDRQSDEVYLMLKLLQESGINIKLSQGEGT